MTTGAGPSSAGKPASRRANYSRRFDLPDHTGEYGVGGAMLPIFLNDLGQNRGDDFVEVTLEMDNSSIVVCSVAPAAEMFAREDGKLAGVLERSPSSVTARIRQKFEWITSSSSRASTSSDVEDPVLSARDARRMSWKLQRTKSSAQRALKGLRFISKAADTTEMWERVEARFKTLAKDGLLGREDFGECIGMVDSKEFAIGIFDALTRRKRQKITKITIDELHDFWLQISDQSFDARIQIFFDMADSNEDGRITRDEVQELIMLSASANKLATLKERSEEFASLIMEELDPENLGYIELWQLETLLLQRDSYLNCSRPLSTASVSWSQKTAATFRPMKVVRKVGKKLQCLVLENWQRGWILLVWAVAMAGLFAWRFFQYRNRAAFHVMGYCLSTAKGAAETLKLNMALILLPVCRNTLTWLRSTGARSFVPIDDNINFHKVIASAIAIGILVHGGIHLTCDFPRLINAPPDKFSYIAPDFHNKRPTYKDLMTGIEGVTGMGMVVLMIISYTLAGRRFRRNLIQLPSPLNRLTGFNAFWYSHHLLGLVYLLLIIHGTFLLLTHQWHQKTTLAYITVPLLLYVAERSLRTCRSEHYSVDIIKVSVLPGNVLSIIMSKPRGFKYRSGQYIYLQCPIISQFEWHPFSITSAPGDNYLSVHIRTVGDWTRELKRLFTENHNSRSLDVQAKLGQLIKMDDKSHRRLLVDGPYGAPAQDYENYDVLLLVGLGIGATPFISILRDLLNNTKTSEEQTDTNTEISRSADSVNSFASSTVTSAGKPRTQRTPNAHFYWVTREPGSFEWFKGVMDEVAEIDQKGQFELHNYLTSVYEECDARSTLITMVQALNHAKNGIDILSGTQVRTHFARPNWREVFTKVASKHPFQIVGVFYCGMPALAKELKKLSQELSHRTSTRFEFHKEYF